MSEQLPLFGAEPSERSPFRLQVYDLTEPSLLEAVIDKLERIPPEQWPSEELHHNMLISVKLRQMELAEIEAPAVLQSEGK